MKAINVSRVSTEEQKDAGNSLPAQIERIKRYCEKKSFDVIKSFSFDESAYKDKRDEFDKLLEYVQKIAKKEKVAVCLDKVDRLSRSVFDKRVGTLYEMAIADKIELHFVSEGQIINNQMSAVEKFQFGMSLGLAKYYSDAIGDNVKRAFEQKRRNGEWTGPVGVGYLNVSLDEGKRLRKDIIIDPEKGPLVRKLFEIYATRNYSLNSLKQEATLLGLKGKNGKELSKSAINFILRNQFYCGTAVPKKHPAYVHKYPRLIDRSLFERCQKILSERHKTPFKALSRDYVFKGLLRCQNCGCSMTPEYHRKTNGKEYILYSCTNAKGICKREYVNESNLLKPIYEILDKFGTISEKTQEDLVAELRKNTEKEVVFHKTQIHRIHNEYESAKKKDDRLLEVFLDERITKDDYDRKHQEIQDKLQLLNIELEEYQKADYNYQTTVSTVISVARRARSIFENCSEPAEKRAFLSFLLQNPTVKAKKLDFTLASPFNLVLELADCPTWLRGSDSNRQPTR